MKITEKIAKAWVDGVVSSLMILHPGVIPASIEGVGRSSNGDGWNACNDKRINRLFDFLAFLKTHDDQLKEVVRLLMDDDHFCFNPTNSSLEFNCGRVFRVGCSDREKIRSEEICTVCELYDKYGIKGVYAWVAHKRGTDPILESYKSRAFKDIQKELTLSGPDV